MFIFFLTEESDLSTSASEKKSLMGGMWHLKSDGNLDFGGVGHVLCFLSNRYAPCISGIFTYICLRFMAKKELLQHDLCNFTTDGGKEMSKIMISMEINSY